MKNLLPILLLVVACLQSCVIYVNEPQKPSNPTNPSGGQPWWYDTDSDDVDSDYPPDTIITIVGDTTKHEDSEPPTPTEDDTTQNFVPTSKYEVDTIAGVMVFNVYLGWPVGQMETAVLIRDFPSEGGEIIFNIYTNNLYMSMYGFEKYRTDFYIFSSEPPYCGYSSYSLDTQAVCKYKMIITANETGHERSCVGYWACNDGGGFYSSFRIVLYQSCNARD